MTTIAIVGTVLSALIVVGIIVSLAIINWKINPPRPKIAADRERRKLESESGESDRESGPITDGSAEADTVTPGSITAEPLEDDPAERRSDEGAEPARREGAPA